MRNPYVLGLLLVAGLCGCSERMGSEKLSGAMKRDIPVYEPSDLVGREASRYQAGMDFSDLRPYHAYHWTLRSPDPPERVVEFYQALAVPPEEEEEEEFVEELEEAEEIFLELPSGDSDSVSVRIQLAPTAQGGTEFAIRESVPAGRRD